MTSPAVETAKSRKVDDITTLTTGIRVRFAPVGACLIMEVQNHIRYPAPPKIRDENTGKEYDNPDHPTYLAAVEDVNMRRGMAATDALIMFGVELVDGVPEDDTWIKKLRMLERMGQVSLEGYDFENEIDREFLYKRYIAVSAEDLEVISRMGATREGVKSAEDSFQGNKE